MLDVSYNQILFFSGGRDHRYLVFFFYPSPSFLACLETFFLKSFLVCSTDFRKYLFNERMAGRAQEQLGPEPRLALGAPSLGLRSPIAIHCPVPGIPGMYSAHIQHHWCLLTLTLNRQEMQVQKLSPGPGTVMPTGVSVSSWSSKQNRTPDERGEGPHLEHSQRL